MDIHCVQGTTPDYFGYSLELSGEVSLRLLDCLKSLYKDIHGSQMMNSNNFGDPLTFPLAQSSQLFNWCNSWFIYLTIQSHETTGGPAVFLLSVPASSSDNISSTSSRQFWSSVTFQISACPLLGILLNSLLVNFCHQDFFFLSTLAGLDAPQGNEDE